MFFKRGLRCSFCGRPDAEVNKLVAGPRLLAVAGPRVYICDRCVDISARLMAGSHEPAPAVKS